MTMCLLASLLALGLSLVALCVAVATASVVLNLTRAVAERVAAAKLERPAHT